MLTVDVVDDLVDLLIIRILKSAIFSVKQLNNTSLGLLNIAKGTYHDTKGDELQYAEIKQEHRYDHTFYNV